MADEYSDSIDNFKKPKQVSIQMPQQGQGQGQMPQQGQGQGQMPQQGQGPKMTEEQMKVYQHQQMLQQQKYMQQQQMIQQQQMMQQQQSMNGDSDKSLLTKLKNLNVNQTLQEVLVLSVLFIIFSSSFYRDTITKYIPMITVSNNELNTMGILISAVLLSVVFIISRTII